MSDLIDRQEAISRAVELRMYGKPVKMVAVSELERLPAVRVEHGETTLPEQADSDRLGVKTGETCTDVISRQAAIDEIDEWIKAFLENGHKESAADARLIQDGIIQLPPTQPEIIRCKDCKWYERADKRRFYRGMDCLQKRINTIIPDKDFCSRAERREDENRR